MLGGCLAYLNGKLHQDRDRNAIEKTWTKAEEGHRSQGDVIELGIIRRCRDSYGRNCAVGPDHESE